jgi:hypothetical protein
MEGSSAAVRWCYGTTLVKDFGSAVEAQSLLGMEPL